MKYGISYVIGLKSGQTRQNRFDVVIIHGKMPDLFTKLLNMGSGNYGLKTDFGRFG